MAPTLFTICYVVGALLIVEFGRALLNRSSVPKQHEKYREVALHLLRRRLELEAELADVDADLVEIWQKAPTEQALWLARSRERVELLPHRLRLLARRFGYKLPDVDNNRTPSPLPAAEDENPAKIRMEVVPGNAWGGPPAVKGNGATPN